MSKTLVVGASGATGRHLLRQLLDKGVCVRAIVRAPNRLPEDLRTAENLEIIVGNISDMDQQELTRHAKGCNAVASCLGHNLSFKGMFGAPHRLVTDATKKLCSAIESNELKSPVKYLLMNTAGNRHRGLNEKISFAQTCVIGLLRLLLPPHADNEDAAEYLRSSFSNDNKKLQWCVIRPDSLTNESNPSDYVLHPSPIRSAIFNAGKTSRINVGVFMATLIMEDDLWSDWRGRMPVIYNSDFLESSKAI